MSNNIRTPNPAHYFIAWAVHIFTASAAFIGILSLFKIYQHEYIAALYLMAVTVLIDALDGSLARLANVKKVLPKMDGALLDNMVDYFTYVLIPCFFLLVKGDMLPASCGVWIIVAIIITSAYQFCQSDAKTPDHFFKGFPCYWNYVIFYMFIFNSSPIQNAFILILLCILIFIPIKYIYPSRLDYLTPHTALKVLAHVCSLIYGISFVLILMHYPKKDPLWLGISFGYVTLYFIISLYRTFSPMRFSKIAVRN